MNTKESINVFHLRKMDNLTDQQIYFLKQLFQLKNSDQFNLNKLLTDHATIIANTTNHLRNRRKRLNKGEIQTQ